MHKPHHPRPLLNAALIPFTTEYPQIFEVVGALEPPRHCFLVGKVRVGNEGKTKAWEAGLGEVQDWKEFRGRAMPVLMGLVMMLDDAGLGLGRRRVKRRHRRDCVLGGIYYCDL